ncbi:MAG: carboxypeptidase-like regulatory domain-containing protein, partial [Muribaculaceae bacterium]|nr:carboxypeptidase-like regulatory domain-containing protein [Muribaculaceae bacterium]
VADDRSYFSVAGGEEHDLELILALRGSGILASPISAEEPLYIDRKELPAGLYQALLVSRSDSVVMSERLFFIGADRNNPKISSVSRDSMSLTLKNSFGTSGDCAVRIVNGKILQEKNDRDILTRLLLESELRGRIENPAYYFSDDPEAEQYLDLLMMVNGWSRYNIPEAIKGRYEEPLIPLEIGQEISGQVRSRWKGKPMKGVLVYAIAPKLNFGTFDETNAQGNFRLNGFDLPEGTSFIFRAMNVNGNNESNYYIDEEEYPSIDRLREVASGAMDLDAAEYFKNIRWIMLDEIKVQAFNKNSEMDIFQAMSSYTRKAEYFSKKGITSLEQALRGIPGMSVRNGYLVYRNEKVGYVIDGTQFDMPGESASEDSGILNVSIPGTYATSRFADRSLANANPYNKRMLSGGTSSNSNSQGNAIFTPTLADLERYIPFSSIERLDFIKSGGFGGVLVLTTSSGGKRTKETQFELKDYLPLGYQRYKEYASPLLSVDADEYDLQTHPTLLWLPSVRFDGNGHAINLKSPISADYKIFIEGITDNGDIISEMQ